MAVTQLNGRWVRTAEIPAPHGSAADPGTLPTPITGTLPTPISCVMVGVRLAVGLSVSLVAFAGPRAATRE